MAKIALNPSNVVFDEQNHEYWLGDTQLSGITRALKEMLYPDLYEGVPEFAIRQAGRYGHEVHLDLQKFDQEYINSGSVEVQDYIRLCKEHNLVHEGSEVVCSDEKNWASCIDKVYRVNEDTVSLGDIKTYAKLTPEKLELARYQLSCYAWMLQLRNPKLKIDKLYIIHLRNRMTKSGKVEHVSQIVEVARVPSFICEELLNAYLNGETFVNPYSVPPEICSQESTIRELLSQKALIDQQLSELKESILSSMEKASAKSYLTDTGMRLTRILPTVRTSFNLQLFQKDHPEYDYSKYMRQSNVSQSLKIAI